MKSLNNLKSCLILSYGPVPTPDYQTVEGGGMRAWGLAQGLRDNGIDVTVAVNSGFPQNLSIHEDIFLKNWSLDDEFKHKINDYDAVIVSYCMGDLSEFVAEHISLDTQLILDAYVPIYIEVSARDSNNIEQEYAGYMREIQRYNKVLKRGDYFLCANETQKTFYIGVLSSLGVVNPRSYREHRILVAPFGIEDQPQKPSRNPYAELGIKLDDFVVLWFGGLYPWFRVEEFLETMKSLKKNQQIKFVIVGSKNPYNSAEDFVRQHNKAYRFCEHEGLLDSSVYFVDWVDYAERINWYKHADIVISLNQPGEENAFSWRTRVMDYIWGDMVIVSNGGDPLSEELIGAGAAFRLPDLSTAAIESAILQLYRKPKEIHTARKHVRDLKAKYYWSQVTSELTNVIDHSDELKPYRKEKEFAQKIGALQSNGLEAKLKRVGKVVPKARGYIRQHGLKNTVRYSAELVGVMGRNAATRSGKRYVFISHPIDNTGAPLVLMEIVKEFTEKFGARHIKLVAPNVNDTNRRALKKLGVQADKAAGGYSSKILRFQLALRPDDYVMMNTIAIHDNYRQYIFAHLNTGKLKEAHWFIHEDEAQFRVIAPHLLEPHNIQLIRNLANDGKLKLYVPSKRTRDSLNKLFGIKSIQVVPLRLNINSKHRLERKSSDYKQLTFLLSGNPSDGRKGQLIALAAFEKFLTKYYAKDPKRYRLFRLQLLSIGHDYMSEQIRWIGSGTLGDRLVVHPSVSYERALGLAKESNAVICCSLNETFALYVAEGMVMGHVVLRNNSAGMEEQLVDGKNGYFIDHTDILQFATIIERLLNRQKTTDEALAKMGRESQSMIEPYLTHTYLDKVL